MTERYRWLKFWPADWRNDAALRMCSLAARGLWIECIGLMHDAEPYGHLLVNGRVPSMRQLAVLVGCTEREAKTLMDELHEAGVFSVSDDGTPYSRRMVRDDAKAEVGRESAERRWSQKEKSKPPRGSSGGGPNRSPKGQNASNHMLEAEAEAEESSLRSLSPRVRRASDTDDFERWWLAYPRRVGKGAARKAWLRAEAKAGADVLLAALHRQRWPADPRFIPHPATWLNGERWADDPGASAPPPVPSQPASKLGWMAEELGFGIDRDDDRPTLDLAPEPVH